MRGEIKGDEKCRFCVAAWSSGHDTRKRAHDLHGRLLLRSWQPLFLSPSYIYHDMIKIKFMRRSSHGSGQWTRTMAALLHATLCTVAWFSLSNANDYKNLILFVIGLTVYLWLLPIFRHTNCRPSWRKGHNCHVTGDLPFVVRNQE